MKGALTMDRIMKSTREIDGETLSPEEKKLWLFCRQRNLLDQFLANHAISKQQYDKSLGDLIVKMDIPPEMIQKD